MPLSHRFIRTAGCVVVRARIVATCFPVNHVPRLKLIYLVSCPLSSRIEPAGVLAVGAIHYVTGHLVFTALEHRVRSVLDDIVQRAFQDVAVVMVVPQLTLMNQIARRTTIGAAGVGPVGQPNRAGTPSRVGHVFIVVIQIHGGGNTDLLEVVYAIGSLGLFLGFRQCRE